MRLFDVTYLAPNYEVPMEEWAEVNEQLTFDTLEEASDYAYTNADKHQHSVVEIERRILVTGGRKYNDQDAVFAALDAIPVSLLIQGGATGADALAGAWAEARGVQQKVFKADWKNLTAPGAVIKQGRYGPYNALAGFARNQNMIDVGKPHLVVAFPGGTGTADMVQRAKNAGVEVKDLRAG